MLPGAGKQLVVPKSSVLWTGKRAIVYVMTKDSDNLFQYREIKLGAEADDYYVVEEGLQAGEMVATNGVFKIDAAAQLQGKTSMMNPEGGKVSLGHDHGSMDPEMQGDQDEVDHSEHQEIEEEMIMEIDPDFKKQLKNVFNQYLTLVDGLVESNAQVAHESAQKVKKAVEAVDMSLLKGDAHIQWMAYLQVLNKSLNEITNTKDIEAQRISFGNLSEVLYQAIKYFSITGLDAFYQYCPMAENGKGAFWLSNNEEIRNPYFGESMLTCGETKEKL